MPAGVLLAGAGIGLAGVAPSYALTFAAIVLSGIGVAAFHPEGARHANYASGASKARGMSLFAVGGNAGFALGPVLTTVCVLAVGLPGTLLLALLPLAAGVTLLVKRARLHGLRVRGAAAAEARPDAALQDRWGPFARLTAVISLRSCVHFGLLAFVPVWFVTTLGTSEAAGNGALTAMLAAGAVGTVIGGRIADTVGRRTILLGALALAGPALVAFIQAPIGLAFPLIALTGMLVVGTFAITVVLGQEYLPNRLGMASGRDARSRDRRRRRDRPATRRARGRSGHRGRHVDDRRAAAGRAGGGTDAAGSGAEDAVARVAEPGPDIGVLVELAVHRGGPDRDLGVMLLDRRQPLWRDHEADQREPLRPRRAQAVERVDRAAPRRQHRVDDEDVRVGQPRWQPLVVVDRAVLLLVAVDPDVTHARAREQPQEPVDHAQPGAEHGHDRDLARQAAAGGGLERRLDLDRAHRQIAGGLDGEDRRRLEQGLAELAVARVAVAHHGQPIGEHRVVDHDEPLGHGRTV